MGVVRFLGLSCINSINGSIQIYVSVKYKLAELQVRWSGANFSSISISHEQSENSGLGAFASGLCIQAQLPVIAVMVDRPSEELVLNSLRYIDLKMSLTA